MKASPMCHSILRRIGSDSQSSPIGYAEDTWSQLLRDFSAGQLKPRYNPSPGLEIGGRPFPRRDLLPSRHFLTDNVFEATRGKTAEFAGEARIDLPRFAAVTPFPNTPLFHRLEAEGRLLTKDGSLYDAQHVVFQPAKMSVQELQRGVELAWIHAYSQLAPAWTIERILNPGKSGLAIDAFGVVRTKGRIIAAGALWDQRPFRQTVIRGCSRSLACVRPIVNPLGGVFGLSPLPRVGSVLSHAFLSPLATSTDSASVLGELVSSFGQRAAAKSTDYLTLALPSNDVRLTELRRCFRTRSYSSRLYRVRWPGDPTFEIESRPIPPDVALL